jgi:beta-glucosidase
LVAGQPTEWGHDVAEDSQDMLSGQFAGRWWWGAGASAVQTEGASPADDWYRWEREGKAPISADGNGFATCFETDFALLRDLGLTDYRLSVNWARVVPEPGQVDQAAVDYYRAVLSSGQTAGLRMWVCLLHTAIPVWFADQGGFAGKDAMEMWLEWVGLAATLFADLAGGWMPFNGPTSYVHTAYLAGTFPPGHRDIDETVAVLRAVHTCDFEAALTLQSTGKPVCSNEALLPLYPADDSAEAASAVARLDAIVWESWLRLARHPRYEKAFDLYGFAYYYGAQVTGQGTLLPHPAEQDAGPLSYVPWPDGLATVLERLHRELPDSRFVVAELGYGSGPDIEDSDRCEYLSRGLRHIAAAQANGMRIEGVSLWTGVDNYEWLAGYDVSFGLFSRAREPRNSASFLRKTIRGH